MDSKNILLNNHPYGITAKIIDAKSATLSPYRFSVIL